MLVSYKWLKDYVEFNVSAQELAKRLTDIGLEEKSIQPNSQDPEDFIFEIEVTPNRPDCLSMIGISREVAAIFDTSLKMPELNFPEDDEAAQNLTSVVIEDPDLCPRYAARVIRGVKISPSPEWLVKRLESSGIRAINNIVDITNYILLEYGHPMHAFDLNRLGGKKIIVRRAKPGESLVTLDGKKYLLNKDQLVIADAAKPVALAGVMGGLDSEVLSSSTDILLEAAYFNPISIRRTAKKLGIHTEASYRFERGVDPENAILAINRAAQLIAQIAGGKIAKGIIDVYPVPEKPPVISLRINRVNELLGTELSAKTIISILEKLGCKINPEMSNILFVQVPSFRRDLVREIDLVEEIARIYGYDKIPTTSPMIAVNPVFLKPGLNLDRLIKETLPRLGFWEVMNYSQVNSADLVALGFEKEELVAMRNPLSSEQDVLRPSLLPGLIKNISMNIQLGESVVRVFEIGQVMKNTDKPGTFIENTSLGVAASGKNASMTWEEKSTTIDFYGMKGLLEYLFKELKLPEPTYKPFESFLFITGKAAQIFMADKWIGCIGQVHPEVITKLGGEKDYYYLEINLDELAILQPLPVRYKALPKYPAVIRDISVLVPYQVTTREIVETVKSFPDKDVESVVLFDLYSGDKIPTGYRSLAFRITYRNLERTLQEAEVDINHQTILQSITEKYQVRLRTV